jgi:hypothetical protein
MIVKSGSRDDRDHIAVFIQDLQNQIRKEPFNTSFFDRLGGLSIGPVRVSVLGSCSRQDLNILIPDIFAQIRGAFPWPTYFDNLESDL